MALKVGTRMGSTVCQTQVVIVRSPAESVELRCGGAPLTDDLASGPVGEPAEGLAEGTLVGKRYVPAEGNVELELLCTRAGAGTLTCNGSALTLKEAKPLPASD